jgi:hypothetical protein
MNMPTTTTASGTSQLPDWSGTAGGAGRRAGGGGGVGRPGVRGAGVLGAGRDAVWTDPDEPAASVMLAPSTLIAST